MVESSCGLTGARGEAHVGVGGPPPGFILLTLKPRLRILGDFLLNSSINASASSWAGVHDLTDFGLYIGDTIVFGRNWNTL